MALLVIPVCHNLQDRLSAIEEFSQMLQNLTEAQCQSELGRVIITTIINIAKKEIDLIPDTTTEDIIRTVFVFFLSSSPKQPNIRWPPESIHPWSAWAATATSDRRFDVWPTITSTPCSMSSPAKIQMIWRSTFHSFQSKRTPSCRNEFW